MAEHELTTLRKERIEQVVEKVIKQYGQALLGLAHYDKGEKVKGCNCCYCKED